jgi:hypothetical protein
MPSIPGVAVPGTVVPVGSQASPGGPQGIQGPSGSSGSLSTDANNKATLGTDSKILVQGTAPGVAATTHALTVSGDDPRLAVATATTSGIVPTPPNDVTKVLRGDASWGTAAAGGGTKTINRWFANQGMQPFSNYALWGSYAGSGAMLPYIAFNDTTAQSIFFIGIMPESVALGSGVIVKLVWISSTANSGAVKWNVAMDRMVGSLANDSYDTAATGTTTTNGSTSVVNVTTITLTTLDGTIAEDSYKLQVLRDAANAADTMVGDAWLHTVEVRSV